MRQGTATGTTAPPTPSDWHAQTAAEAATALGVTTAGLGPDEAAQRLRTHGPNALPAAARRSPVLRFLAQFNNALIYLLIAAAAASFALGHHVDGAVIAAVVIVNAIVGFVQEGRAEEALNAIRDMIAPHATVVRGGERHSIDARAIVPGDLVVLEAGDRVPADLRLVRARQLTADEAILTGESVPAEKSEPPVAADAPLADRASMLYSGSLIATGQGTGIAVATGTATEIGRISSLIGSVRATATPLLAQIDQFGKWFTWVSLAAAAALFAFATLARSYDGVEALMVVVALTVGAVPEGLPAVITITLAIGVRRMAARNAVVRRLPAVETLGATSVICSDKTGTLTRNEMTVRRVATVGAVTLVTGSGYGPEGALTDETGGPAPADPAREAIVEAAALCNDARIAKRPEGWAVLGDPMEGALLALAGKAGLDPATARAAAPRIDEIPFDAVHRFMATLNDGPDGRMIFVKGAPERVLSMCGVSAEDRAFWHARIEAAGENGERVLGFARKPVDPEATLDFAALESGLEFLGLVGFIDPPREEAIRAIAECRSAGIAVKMITGDHAATAVAIARQLAIADAPKAIEGAALDGLSDEALREVVKEVSVYARAAPEHKLRIVSALQANGEIVAMTGDGVNDAPAVKKADVGVAMGLKGTEAAKEAAQMVLLDDNFASIVAAVHEGRTVYDNIRKVIGWTLPTNGGEALAVIVAIVLGVVLPMTPVQILWINMILTVTLGMVLAFEPAEPGVMRRPPRRRDAPILSPFLLWRIGLVSVLFTAGVFGIFDYAMRRGFSVETAQTMVVNTVVVMEIFYLFNVRYRHMTSFSLVGAAGTPAVLGAVGAVVVAQLAFTYLPVMQRLFGTAPVPFLDGLVILAIGVVLMVILEVEKALMRRLRPDWD